MSADNLIRLYDSGGRTITEFHPDFKERLIEFGYEGPPERRGKPRPLAQSGSETWNRHRDRLKSMADARDLAHYDWIGGVLARIVLYVAGQIHSKGTIGEPQVDQAYDDYFHGWCGDQPNEDGTTRCDLSGRHRLIKMIQMSFLAYLVDGDHGFVEVDPMLMEPESGVTEFCLQSIEADRIGKPEEGSTDEDYIGGIKIDTNTGRILYYRIYRRTRNGQYVDEQEIPFNSFIHVFDPDRSDEYRGTTKLLRLLNDMRDIREWIEAEKQAGKTQAQWAAMIGTRDPFNNTGPMAWTGQNTAGTPTQDAQWGKILKMAEGENFAMLSPSARPSGSFMAFVQMIIRKMAASLGLSYGLLWDLSALGGVSQRIEVQSDLRRIQYWQTMLTRVLNRIRTKVIAQGIALQQLPPHPLWQKLPDWNFGPYITADLGHEMEADIAGIQAGFVPLDEVTRKYGRMPREVFQANAGSANAAIDVASENQIPVEVFARGIYPDITQQKAAFMTPTPVPPPEPGTFDAVGDKGVKQIVEILTAVGDGTLDRESAINTLVQTFGIPRSKVDKMVPEEPSEEDKNREAGLDPDGNHPPVAPAKQQTSKKSKQQLN